MINQNIPYLESGKYQEGNFLSNVFTNFKVYWIIDYQCYWSKIENKNTYPMGILYFSARWHYLFVSTGYKILILAPHYILLTEYCVLIMLSCQLSGIIWTYKRWSPSINRSLFCRVQCQLLTTITRPSLKSKSAKSWKSSPKGREAQIWT